MSEHGIGRRQLVRGAAGVAAGGALAVGTGVGVASAGTNDQDMGRGLLGSWWVTHTNDPPAAPDTGISVVGIAAGGVIISNDIRPAGAVSNGAWMMSGDRFRATFWGSEPGAAAGDPSLSIRIKVKGQLHDGKIMGTFMVTGYANSQPPMEVFTQPGTFTGTRMSA
jgi:hypothetical protein